MTWTTPADVLHKLRKRWDRGEFLRQLACGKPWEPLALPLRTPSARDVVDHFDETRSWVERWRRDTSFRIETRAIGGKVVGANEIPAKAWVDSYTQLWSLLGVGAEVERFTALLEETTERAPQLADWMRRRPTEVLRHAEIWHRLVDTVLWIDQHAGPEMYLRQLDVPGVDTKFVESHRRTLAALLDQQLPADRVVPDYPPSEFARRYRFRDKPAYVRFRHLAPVEGFSELTVRVEELAACPPAATTVFVVENEISYLALPPVPGAIAIFGSGYGAGNLRSLTWLADRKLVYWGDIDTHGFAILHRLRQTFGHARSMLMDRGTLLDHRDHWTHEPSRTTDDLDRLRPVEAELYRDLVHDTLGRAVRLEQERISFGTVQRAVDR